MKKRTQEWVAEHTQLTQTHLSHIETGNTEVSLPSLLRIATALDVTLDDGGGVIQDRLAGAAPWARLLFP